MPLLTDMMLKKIAPTSTPLADVAVKGLRFEPGHRKATGKWTLRFTSPVMGKRRDMGLGTYPEIGIADARSLAMLARRKIADGIDPIEERRTTEEVRRAAAEALTFGQASRAVHDELKPGWRNGKHADQWINTLREYAFPSIARIRVADLQPSHFADVLRPIWLTKPETASRVKQRCHRVMAWCWAHGSVASNPVDVVGHLLPKQEGVRERVKHHPAMLWRDVPRFVHDVLRAGPVNTTRALLEFVILTAARSGEARGMAWDEVNLQTAVWTVPADRMKARAAHRVPLSDRAVEILKAQRARHPEADLVFPALRGGTLSDMVLTKFLRDHNAPSAEKARMATAHGFRSSFRDWASESGYAHDLAERALAHTIRNQSEAAYHRTDLLEQRRTMMRAWADYVTGADAQKIVPLRRPA